jgi:hypothetical protein
MKTAMAEELAQQLADDIVAFHGDDLHSGGEKIKNAVIVKTVALVVLAFGIPAVPGEPVDIEDAITKLREALSIIGNDGEKP